MAALDTPWLNHMSASKSNRGESLDPSQLAPPWTPSRKSSYSTPQLSSGNDAAEIPEYAPVNAPNATYAPFSPATLNNAAPSASSAAKRRSTILVHQKSPLLLATPPQITRALAYSHPFLLPLNKLAGLLSWSTGDAWESFLMVVVFWAATLYGDVAIRYAGPIVLVLVLIASMYGRRFSPLSSSGWSDGGPDGAGAAVGKPAKGKGKGNGKDAKNASMDGAVSSATINSIAAGGGGGGLGAGGGGGGGGHTRKTSSVGESTNTRHQKTLDEIVETLKEFTGRCNILLEPALELTDFLSTQRTPTLATTRPALTTLFVRILLCTPFWVALTLPPWRIVTTRRVVLVFGTIILTWHARVSRVSRAILWRSATVRRLAALVTGLSFEGPMKPPGTTSKPTSAASALTKASSSGGSRESEVTKALHREKTAGKPGGSRSYGDADAGVRFTFIIFENQRRWVGLGWTTSLFAYERAAWTDEHNNPVPPRDEFELPEVDEETHRMRWRWVEGSRWRVDGVPDDAVRTSSVKEKKDHGEEDEEEGENEEWEYDGDGGRMGWVYYDNKWQNGRRGQDGWGRWTRRRKWYRDAELVEVESDEEEDDISEQLHHDEEGKIVDSASGSGNLTPTPTSTLAAMPGSPAVTVSSSAGSGSPSSGGGAKLLSQSAPHTNTTDASSTRSGRSNSNGVEGGGGDDGISVLSSSAKSTTSRWPLLRRRGTDQKNGSNDNSKDGTANGTEDSSSREQTPKKRGTGTAGRSRAASEVLSEDEAAGLGLHTGLEIQGAGKERDQWGVGDEMRMGLE